MSGSVDYYDVQGMIREASSELRGHTDNTVREASRQLRSDLHETFADLRQGLAEANAQIAALRSELESAWRTLDARTGHLA